MFLDRLLDRRSCSLVVTTFPLVFERIAQHRLRTRAGEFLVRGYEGNNQMLVVALGSIAPAADARWLVRIQLSCLFGEAFSSLDCDCALQLSAALTELHAAPAGLLVYFPGMDGRGTGLKAKLRLMEVEETLNLPPISAAKEVGMDHSDLSSFRILPHVLRDWGIAGPIRLLTGSEEKLEAVERAGITVSNVLPLTIDERGLSDVAKRELEEKMAYSKHRLAREK